MLFTKKPLIALAISIVTFSTTAQVEQTPLISADVVLPQKLETTPRTDNTVDHTTVNKTLEPITTEQQQMNGRNKADQDALNSNKNTHMPNSTTQATDAINRKSELKAVDENKADETDEIVKPKS